MGACPIPILGRGDGFDSAVNERLTSLGLAESVICCERMFKLHTPVGSRQDFE